MGWLDCRWYRGNPPLTPLVLCRSDGQIHQRYVPAYLPRHQASSCAQWIRLLSAQVRIQLSSSHTTALHTFFTSIPGVPSNTCGKLSTSMYECCKGRSPYLDDGTITWTERPSAQVQSIKPRMSSATTYLAPPGPDPTAPNHRGVSTTRFHCTGEIWPCKWHPSAPYHMVSFTRQSILHCPR